MAPHHFILLHQREIPTFIRSLSKKINFSTVNDDFCALILVLIPSRLTGNITKKQTNKKQNKTKQKNKKTKQNKKQNKTKTKTK